MKATDLLKMQHRRVSSLFKRIAGAADATKTELFEELAAKLVAHDAIEREIFYPACEAEMGMTDLLGEALVEHGLVEFSLYQANQAQGGGDFDDKCSVLQEVVEHHVKEEEEEFFPRVEKALGQARLEELGEQMQERLEAAKHHDFRLALHRNLKQVLALVLEAAVTGHSMKRGARPNSLPPPSSSASRA